MDISVVVPCYNEADVIQRFWDRLSLAMPKEPGNWEVIFVNDGSKDDTLKRLLGLNAGEGSIVVVDFSRNFGKEAAITAGLDRAQGHAVIVIDADLQHPPELIADMIALWRSGAEVVLCKRRTRNTDSALRRWLTGRFYSLSNRLFEVNMPRDVGDFRLMDRVVVDALGQLRESQRFMKGIFAWVGFEQRVIEFDVADRVAGRSSFNLWSLWNFACEGITSFTTAPLTLWFYVGLGISFLAFLYGIAIVIDTILFKNGVPGYTSIIAIVCFLGGLQLIGIGVMGEYLGRTYRETKRRPLYIVRRAIERHASK